MKPIHSIVLTVLVLLTSACASNAAKSPPAPAYTQVQATANAPLAPAAAAATETVIVSALSPPSADTDAASSSLDNAPATPSVALAAPDPAEPTPAQDPATEAEQDAQALYAQQAVRDPWEGYNRKMHRFNNVLDRFLLRPVAVGYDKVMPDAVQSGVSRFFNNLRLPGTAVNQALQGHPGHAGQSLGRFVVNTTVGIGGVFDPATRFGLPKRDGEDFGQTLATWGWRDSRYLVMPLLGPRTVRDTVAIVGDQPLSPIGYVDDSGTASGLQLLQMVDGRARMLPMDEARRQAPDDYAFVRDAWAQRRNHQIQQDLRGNKE